MTACVDLAVVRFLDTAQWDDLDPGVEQAMRDDLAWEVGLTHQVARDGSLRFGPVAL